jgi:hypothetical protein
MWTGNSLRQPRQVEKSATEQVAITITLQLCEISVMVPFIPPDAKDIHLL